MKKASEQKITVGSKITIQFLGKNGTTIEDEVTKQLVELGHDDTLKNGEISTDSPIGKIILNQPPGNKQEVRSETGDSFLIRIKLIE